MPLHSFRPVHCSTRFYEYQHLREINTELQFLSAQTIPNSRAVLSEALNDAPGTTLPLLPATAGGGSVSPFLGPQLTEAGTQGQSDPKHLAFNRFSLLSIALPPFVRHAVGD